MSIRRNPERSRAILVALDIGRASHAEDRAEEATRLVMSAGAEVVQVIRGRRDRPDAATYAGSGNTSLRLYDRRSYASSNSYTFGGGGKYGTSTFTDTSAYSFTANACTRWVSASA